MKKWKALGIVTIIWWLAIFAITGSDQYGFNPQEVFNGLVSMITPTILGFLTGVFMEKGE